LWSGAETRKIFRCAKHRENKVKNKEKHNEDGNKPGKQKNMLALSTEQKTRLKRINIIRLLVFIGLLTVVGSVLFLVNNLFISFLLAFVISYLARPLIVPLERAGLSYNMALIFIFLVGMVLIGLIGIWAFPLVSQQINNLQMEWPRYSEGLLSLIETIELKAKSWLGMNIQLQEKGKAWLFSLSQVILKDLPSILLQSFSVLLLAPFLAFFMLKDSHKISKRFMLLVPNSVFEMVLDLQYKINRQLGQFIRARFLEAFIVGLVTFLGLSLISFPFASLLGGFTALTNLIPYIGPIIGGVPAVIIALVNDYETWDLFLVIGVYLIAQFIDAGILVPILVARIVNLHPVTVVLLIILGGQFMGILGMIISIPVANALKVTFLAVYEHITQFKNKTV